MPERVRASRIDGLARAVMKLYTRLNVFVYRTSSGRLMSRFPNGSPICLVTMRGARTGRRRVVPLIHVPHGDDVLLVASQGGMHANPAWFHNLMACPEISVTTGSRTRRMHARLANDDEKATLWPLAVAAYPGFARYQRRTARNIPLFICSPG